MSFWKHIFSPNATIVHKNLEDSHGIPKTGRIEEMVDDRLVVAHFNNPSHSEAYDHRELRRLIMVPGLSRGPVLLYPHHFWRICHNGFFWVSQHFVKPSRLS